MKNACRLYLISPPAIERASDFAGDFKMALEAGDVACFQLRLKDVDGTPAPDDEILQAAEQLLPIAVEHEVAFLINDRPDLAVKAGADGVHIGQTDMSYSKARAMLGDDATVGVTCHDSRHLGLVAGEAGADYVAFGAFYPTQTKTASASPDPSILEWWCAVTTVPCVAIGGITPANCDPLVRAGADFLAVSGAVWNHEDGPAAAVSSFVKAMAAA